MKYDYLKYWRVVREWFRFKHGLTVAEFDLLLFLYSEEYFTSTDFCRYEDIYTWDDQRFHKMKRDGWITQYRKATPGVPAVYNVSTKTKKMVGMVYKTLMMEAEIPEHRRRNKMFNKKVPFSHKMMREAIMRMNKEVRELRLRRAQESRDNSENQA